MAWGGKRAGAGGKKQPGSGVPHRSREAMRRRLALHVTMRVGPSVYNLRSQRSMNVIPRGLLHGAARFGVLVVRSSVQGNHMHFLVEADDAQAMARAMKGLAVRLAKGLNKMMGRRRGQVFAQRYHSRVLRTPTEVRNVMRYLRENHRHHHGSDALPANVVDVYTTDGGAFRGVLPDPTLWLLRNGWRRARGSR